jgi:hypothetical protein
MAGPETRRVRRTPSAIKRDSLDGKVRDESRRRTERAKKEHVDVRMRKKVLDALKEQRRAR